jgi:hypothetical protein
VARTMAPGEGAPRGAASGLWLAGLVLGALALRFAAARGDLWLDEIWSVELAEQAGSAWRILTALHDDNNHHLNTLWLLSVGADPPILARLVSILSGGALVALAWRRRWWAAWLAVCPAIVHYQSEARGYGLALALAVAAYQAAAAWRRDGRTRWLVALAAAATLGPLAHLTFVFVLAGLLAWAAAERPARRAAALAAALAVPAATLFALWAVDLRAMARAGGPPSTLLGELGRLEQAVLGAPAGALGWPVAAVVLGVAGWQVARRWRAGDARWAFFAVVLLGPPVAAALLPAGEFLSARYFLVSVPFLLLLVVEALEPLAARGPAWRWWSLALAALVLSAAMPPLSQLLRVGRGETQAALAWMAARTPGPEVTVGADNPFRAVPVLRFHAARLALPRPLVFVGEIGPAEPTWFLLHRFEGEPPPDPAWEEAGVWFVQQATFPSAGLSGWTWYLYRRTGP